MMKLVLGWESCIFSPGPIHSSWDRNAQLLLQYQSLQKWRCTIRSSKSQAREIQPQETLHVPKILNLSTHHHRCEGNQRLLKVLALLSSYVSSHVHVAQTSEHWQWHRCPAKKCTIMNYNQHETNQSICSIVLESTASSQASSIGLCSHRFKLRPQLYKIICPCMNRLELRLHIFSWIYRCSMSWPK